MVTVVGYYNPRMASREIGEALNDEIGAQLVSNSHEIVRERYHSQAFGFKESTGPASD